MLELPLASYCMLSGSESDARESLRGTVERCQREQCPGVEVKARVVLGDWLTRAGAHDEALSQYEAALGVAEGLAKPADVVLCHLALAKAQVQKGQAADAERHFFAALAGTLSEGEPGSLERAEALVAECAAVGLRAAARRMRDWLERQRVATGSHGKGARTHGSGIALL